MTAKKGIINQPTGKTHSQGKIHIKSDMFPQTSRISYCGNYLLHMNLALGESYINESNPDLCQTCLKAYKARKET